MLPSGHFAAGYLTSKLAISTLISSFPQANEPRFWAVGILSSVLVDLDTFYSFYKIGKPISTDGKVNHRKFFSHAPLLHLGLSLILFFAGLVWQKSDWQLYGILYLVGTWTHFFLDSIGYWIQWLWPFSTKKFTLYDASKKYDLPSSDALSYWKKFFSIYLSDLTFYLEASIILLAIIIKLKLL